jgi:hypothetical protein
MASAVGLERFLGLDWICIYLVCNFSGEQPRKHCAPELGVPLHKIAEELGVVILVYDDLVKN